MCRVQPQICAAGREAGYAKKLDRACPEYCPFVRKIPFRTALSPILGFVRNMRLHEELGQALTRIMPFSRVKCDSFQLYPLYWDLVRIRDFVTSLTPIPRDLLYSCHW